MLGIDVLSIREGRVRMPDAMTTDASRTLELKHAASVNSLEKALRSARGQSRFVIVQAGIGEGDVQAVLAIALRKWGRQFDEIIVIVDDGSSYVHWKA